MVIIQILFLRLVGVGEASFISLAAPFIDDNAPVAQVLLSHYCLWDCFTVNICTKLIVTWESKLGSSVLAPFGRNKGQCPTDLVPMHRPSKIGIGPWHIWICGAWHLHHNTKLCIYSNNYVIKLCYKLFLMVNAIYNSCL